jgi:hypothetical protein
MTFFNNLQQKFQRNLHMTQKSSYIQFLLLNLFLKFYKNQCFILKQAQIQHPRGPRVVQLKMNVKTI